MKYGSHHVEGENARGFFAVFVIHVTAEWVRDRDDCLWDGVGMGNHHNSNTFTLPMLICTLTCSRMDVLVLMQATGACSRPCAQTCVWL